MEELEPRDDDDGAPMKLGACLAPQWLQYKPLDLGTTSTHCDVRLLICLPLCMYYRLQGYHIVLLSGLRPFDE